MRISPDLCSCRNYSGAHFIALHTFVIPVPTIRGYRNLLAKCGDSGTRSTSFGSIPLCYSRNDELSERLEKAEDMLKSFKPGTNADREALLHHLDYYVIYGKKEKAENLANTMRNRFKDDKSLQSDIAYAFEMPNYGSKRDLIYSSDLGKTEPTLALESEKVNGMSVYPNPFNAEAKIVFNIDEPGQVHLAVFNTLGQKVRTLADQRMEQGSHEIFWNGLDDYGNQVSTGLYFVSLMANNKRQIAKMVFAK